MLVVVTTADQEGLWDETLEPSEPRSTIARGTASLVLTLLYHPDLRRIGQRARLDHLKAGASQDISRVEPMFGDRPIADPYVSRRCARLVLGSRGGVTLEATGDGAIRANGQTVTQPLPLSEALLEEGVLVELQSRVAVMVQLARTPESRERYGLVGCSDAIRLACDEIDRVAHRDVPVLVRGESGTGKELVARALHQASERRRGPLVSVNMAGVTPAMAASELFGHSRGAFTGAARNHVGHFGQADGGTLFLDEIGDSPLEVQLMLFRALETSEIQPVGAPSARRVDVRVVAATDQSLEASIAAGTFRAQLYHRLGSYQIDLPPLRQRREDIPALFKHFLTAELSSSADNPLERPLDPKTKPWLPLKLMLRLIRHDWPGNVRELRNAVRQLVVASEGHPRVRVSPALERLLSSPAVATAASSSAATSSEPQPPRKAKAPADISDEELLEALRRNGFAVRATARDLGVSKTSLYQLMDERPGIRKAKDIQRDELVASQREHAGDTKAMSAALEVSVAALRRRLTELGL